MAVRLTQAPADCAWPDHRRSGSPGEALPPTPGMSGRCHMRKARTSRDELFQQRGGEGLTRFARRHRPILGLLAPCGGQRSGVVQNAPGVFVGQPAGQAHGSSNWLRQLSNSRSGFSSAENIKEKSPYCVQAHLEYGGEGDSEPPIRCRLHTFQACSFSHSDTTILSCCSPWVGNGALL